MKLKLIRSPQLFFYKISGIVKLWNGLPTRVRECPGSASVCGTNIAGLSRIWVAGLDT